VRIAIVYNRDSRSVINLFGLPNREKIGLRTIRRLVRALKQGGHKVLTLEGDKDLITRLEDFMPRVLRGERPGLVFNLSYGIQGRARYTHVPSILEMVGIPYIASGPLGHGLALDKVVTKVLLRQAGLPTPAFTVLEGPETPIPELCYPIVVKPKNEALSFGLEICRGEAELHKAAAVIFEDFGQSVLVEQFVDGPELNVGLLGNRPPEAFPPVELEIGPDGPNIYTYEDKTGRSGRAIRHICPARIDHELETSARELAVKAFETLGLNDCARIDMRADASGNLYILEVNSLPSLGEHGSYLAGAEAAGLDFVTLVNRLVSVASVRYFGAPEPPKADVETARPALETFSYVTERRELIERRLKEWIAISSRSFDPIGLQHAHERLNRTFDELGLRVVNDLTDLPEAAVWSTRGGFDGGTLLIAQGDVPMHAAPAKPHVRRDPEWISGEGAGPRAGLVMLELALRSLRHLRRLHRSRVGVLVYFDEGLEARNSGATIREAARMAKRALVLQPANTADQLVVQRRGQRRYRLLVEGEPQRIGRAKRRPDALRWTCARLAQFAAMSVPKERTAVVTLDVNTAHWWMYAPHRVEANVLVTFPDERAAARIEEQMKDVLGSSKIHWSLELVAHRPAMPERRAGVRLGKRLESIASSSEIPLKRSSSAWASVAGLVPAGTACVCGLGPETASPRAPHEAVHRLSLIQRTLLLADFLAQSAT
jgi:D-alanine-D-alanine ligase